MSSPIRKASKVLVAARIHATEVKLLHSFMRAGKEYKEEKPDAEIIEKESAQARACAKELNRLTGKSLDHVEWYKTIVEKYNA